MIFALSFPKLAQRFGNGPGRGETRFRWRAVEPEAGVRRRRVPEKRQTPSLPDAAAPRSSGSPPLRQRIPKRFQVVVIQRHQPARRGEFASVGEPSLGDLQQTELTLVAGKVVADTSEARF